MSDWLAAYPIRGPFTQSPTKGNGVFSGGTAFSIITANTSLAANASVTFNNVNDDVNTNDIVVVTCSAPVPDTYEVQVSYVQNGSFRITIKNLTALAQAHVLKLNVCVLKLGV